MAQEAKGRGGKKRRAPKVPRKMANPPTLASGLDLFYSAFLDLAPGAGDHIAWSDMHAWATLYGLDRAAEEDLIFYTRGLHLVLREHLSHKGKRPVKAGETDDGDDGKIRGRNGHGRSVGAPGGKRLQAAFGAGRRPSSGYGNPG